MLQRCFTNPWALRRHHQNTEKMTMRRENQVKEKKLKSRKKSSEAGHDFCSVKLAAATAAAYVCVSL